jgi:protein TonB
VQRFNQRQGFLVSAILHLTILMILISSPPMPRKFEDVDTKPLETKKLVFMPSAEELRRLLPQSQRPAPRPTPAPVPTPPPSTPGKKDRISIGPPSEIKKPLILHRDDDLTQVAKGDPATPQAPPTPAPATPTPAPAEQKAAGAEERPGRQGLRLPPGLFGNLPKGNEGERPLVGPIGPSVAGAVDELSRRAAREAQAGIPTGRGQSMGGLQFDPQGADFTLWVNRFKDEVYRNWIVPQVALFGAARGHVDFEFTVERDGTMSALRLLKSSGTASLDRAAQNALTSSRLLSLPDDYGPPRVTMYVTFYYGEAPQGS